MIGGGRKGASEGGQDRRGVNERNGGGGFVAALGKGGGGGKAGSATQLGPGGGANAGTSAPRQCLCGTVKVSSAVSGGVVLKTC